MAGLPAFLDWVRCFAGARPESGARVRALIGLASSRCSRFGPVLRGVMDGHPPDSSGSDLLAMSSKRGFNDMSHLCIKRFADDDPSLRPGALRARAKLPWDALAEMDPSGRSRCKLCGLGIPKGQLRLVLLMQCHKGYKTPCTLHFDCFWRHAETSKLESAEEIHTARGVGASEQARIRKAFDRHRIGRAQTKQSSKRRKRPT